MTRVGWLVDQAANPGGAELTQAEFRAAAPEGVEVVDCPAGGVVPDLARYVIHNCMQYTLADLEVIGDTACVRYWHDVGPWLPDGIRQWLYTHPASVCCSPIQADYMGLDAVCIPPPVDLSRFEQAAAQVNGNRKGAVCIGSWRNYGKAPHKAAEWGARNGGVEFFGDGPFAPTGSQPVPYEAMSDLLAHYKTFVFLPQVLEPFGRTVAEAWAAGCAVVTNNLVGAKWWIENKPEALETAAADFWDLVLNV